MSTFVSKISKAGCTYKSAYKLDSKVLLEFSSPQGVSMAVDLGDAQMSDLRPSTITYSKSAAKGVDRQTLLEVMRESNGMTPVLVLEGRVAFLTSGDSVPRLDQNQFVSGEEYEMVRGNNASHLRSIPVVTSVEFEASPSECIKLCDRVASRLSARMLRNIIGSRERLYAAHEVLMSRMCSYLEKREGVLDTLVRDVRSTRDTPASDVARLQSREKDLEVLHSHVKECLAACETIEWYNEALVKHNADVNGM